MPQQIITETKVTNLGELRDFADLILQYADHLETNPCVFRLVERDARIKLEIALLVGAGD